MKTEYKSLSYWHDSLPDPLQARAALQQDLDVDLAIVGAGYTGLWTAYYLKQIDPALNIAILESEVAGFGASGRNGGWCSGFLSGIDMWLENPAQREGALRLQKLMYETVREVGEVAQKQSIDCHFEQSGALEIAVLPAHMQRLRQEVDHQHGLGFSDSDYRWLSATEIRDALNVDKAAGGLMMSHCAAIHPARLARGLAETVVQLGVALYEKSPVLEIKGRELRTLHGRIRAGTTILATEGFSHNLPGQQRRLIPVHSMMVATEPLDQRQLEDINFSKRYTFANGDRVVTYGQVTDDMRIAFGCRGTYHLGSAIQSLFDSGDPEFELIRTTLLRFFPALKGIRFTHAWGGAMGVSRSLRPSVNFDPESGLGWAGGYFGNGVGASHLAGKTMADLVMSRDSERVHTPWVNPSDLRKKWEPEPLRWLGIKSARVMMHLADQLEYRGGSLALKSAAALDKLIP